MPSALHPPPLPFVVWSYVISSAYTCTEGYEKGKLVIVRPNVIKIYKIYHSILGISRAPVVCLSDERPRCLGRVQTTVPRDGDQQT